MTHLFGIPSHFENLFCGLVLHFLALSRAPVAYRTPSALTMLSYALGDLRTSTEALQHRVSNERTNELCILIDKLTFLQEIGTPLYLKKNKDHIMDFCSKGKQDPQTAGLMTMS